MADNRTGETPEIAASNSVKPEQVRSQGGALLRTIPGPARFVMATPGGHSAALISSTTIQTQVLPKVSGQVGGTGVSRINTVPIQATTTTGYHVPRGAAAVANISVPRSSVATPIIRGPTTLQTIGVAQQHSLSSSATNTGRSVVGVTCLSGQQRPSPIPVGARLVSSHQMRPLSEVQARPVLVHTAATTHKQVTLTQQAQVQMGGTVKSYSNAARHPNAPSLSRITPTRSPGMVSLPTAVLLPSQPMKQPQHKVITQQSHGTSSVQLPSVAASSVPQTIAIGAVNRPVVIGSGTAGTPVRPAAKPVSTTPTDTSQQLYIQGGRNTFLLREPARPKEAEPPTLNVSSVNCSAPTTATGVNTIYTLPGAGYFDSGASRPLVTLAPARTNQGAATTTPQMMLNSSVMVVEQPRIHTLVPSTSSDCSQGSTLTTSESSCPPACSAASGVPVLLPKQVTSPRPSILRKRDPEGLVTSSISVPKKSRSPMKGQKNLTPLLATMSSSPPTLPPSPPPKRPESSSGGSTTVSANSSPGESPSAPPLSKEEEEPPPSQLARVLPIPSEVSPRKKPRKQQLTGNQMTEPAFSEDEMEFISEEKIKKEVKDEEIETKVIPKRRTMSLLSSYKNLWKPRNNHFMRYTDVKPKEEKAPSLSEIANQKHALQKINGWKIYHLGSQIEDVVSSEDEFIEFYNSLLCVLEINQKKNKNKEIDKEYSRINERVRANFQRTKVAKDQMLDAKSQIMKFFDHKSYVADIINKNISKRGTGNKKRDRV